MQYTSLRHTRTLTANGCFAGPPFLGTRTRQVDTCGLGEVAGRHYGHGEGYRIDASAEACNRKRLRELGLDPRVGKSEIDREKSADFDGMSRESPVLVKRGNKSFGSGADWNHTVVLRRNHENLWMFIKPGVGHTISFAHLRFPEKSVERNFQPVRCKI